jgi:glycosyltransferase involved in cell wall biosynthesis
MTPPTYVALPTCNVEGLIDQVLDHLEKNSAAPFILSVCDNASTDTTYSRIKAWLAARPRGSKVSRAYLCRLPTRKHSCACINEALKRSAAHPEVTMIAKLDHDYGVPPHWDEVLGHYLYNLFPEYTLLSPSVVPETPKGMQYYTEGHEPVSVREAGPLWDAERSLVDALRGPIWNYEGIAGYCHCFKPETLKRLGGYRPLTPGAVFGSEDADWSLRCGPTDTKGYIMSLQGWHWNKPDIGTWEDKWKHDATFGKTHLQWEDWARDNVPEALRHLVPGL